MVECRGAGVVSRNEKASQREAFLLEIGQSGILLELVHKPCQDGFAVRRLVSVDNAT